MSRLLGAMKLKIREIVLVEERPFTSADFREFEIAGQKHHMTDGTFRNLISKLKKSGVKTGVLICPVIPYITDTIQLVDMLVPYADVIWVYGLSITDRADQNWLNVQEILNDRFPDLNGQIEPVIFAKDHPFWIQLREELAQQKKEHDLDMNIHI